MFEASFFGRANTCMSKQKPKVNNFAIQDWKKPTPERQERKNTRGLSEKNNKTERRTCVRKGGACPKLNRGSTGSFIPIASWNDNRSQIRRAVLTHTHIHTARNQTPPVIVTFNTRTHLQTPDTVWPSHTRGFTFTLNNIHCLHTYATRKQCVGYTTTYTRKTLSHKPLGRCKLTI